MNVRSALWECLKARGFNPELIRIQPREAEVKFSDSHEATMFAGSLMAWGIPRRLRNNLISAWVTFDTRYLQRVMEIMS